MKCPLCGKQTQNTCRSQPDLCDDCVWSLIPASDRRYMEREARYAGLPSTLEEEQIEVAREFMLVEFG